MKWVLKTLPMWPLVHQRGRLVPQDNPSRGRLGGGQLIPGVISIHSSTWRTACQAETRDIEGEGGEIPGDMARYKKTFVLAAGEKFPELPCLPEGRERGRRLHPNAAVPPLTCSLALPMVSSTLAALAGLLSFSSTALAGFSAQSSSNIAIYWGTNPPPSMPSPH